MKNLQYRVSGFLKKSAKQRLPELKAHFTLLFYRWVTLS